VGWPCCLYQSDGKRRKEKAPIDSLQANHRTIIRVVVVSITRMAMYIRVGTTFREHYNDMTCKSQPQLTLKYLPFPLLNYCLYF
jgi:hypothetical protein